MKLENHYYSTVSGVAASLGSFFGKMITYSVSKEIIKISMFDVFVRRDTNVSVFHECMRCHITSFSVASNFFP